MPFPKVDEELLADLRVYLAGKPRTVAEIRARFGIARPTVYRYLEKLENRGYLIKHSGRSRPVRYFLVVSST